jgi:hypothetical protein
MKKNKELAKECFDYYLKERLFKQRLRLWPMWTNGEEPPDYYLKVGSHEFAVQVDVLNGWPATEGPPFWDLQYEAAGCVGAEQEWAESIGRIATERGMRGTYSVSFLMRFAALNDASKQRAEDTAVQYIKDTQQCSPAPPRPIEVGGVRVARIGKLADRTDSAEVVRVSPLDFWVRGERVSQARTVVQTCISHARDALRARPQATTSLPTVLLLVDWWLQGGKGIYQTGIGPSPPRDVWHSIFVVEGASEGYFPLEKHESRWLQLAGNGEPLHHPSGGPTGNTFV